MRKLMNFSSHDLIALLTLSQTKLEQSSQIESDIKLVNYKLYHLATLACCLLNGVSLAFMPFMVGQLIKELAVETGAHNFSELALMFTGLIFVHSVTSVCLELLIYKFSISAICQLRQNLFNLFNYQQYAQANGLTSGELNNILLLDLDYLAQGIEMYYKQFFTALFSLIFSFAIMLKLNIYLTLIIVCLSPLAFLVTRFISQNTHRYFSLAQAAQAKQTSQVSESAKSIMRIKQQGNQAYAVEAFNKHNHEVKNFWQEAIFYSSLANPLNRILNNVIYILVALFGLIFLQMGQVNLASLTAFLTYTNEFSKPFSDLNGVLAELEKAKVAVSELNEHLHSTLSESESSFNVDNIANADTVDNASNMNNADSAHSDNIVSDIKELTSKTPNGELKAEHINFSYKLGKEILHDVSFSLEKGQTLAIVGPSGSGKSTIINLLMQFYEPQSGRISLNQLNAKCYSKPIWRQNFALVLQDSWIFYGTIRENLYFANEKASEAELWQACKAAQLEKFIKRLPKQLDTLIGPGALMLSYSQMQLLSLARLFLRESKIILLDEASSAVDCFSEVKIQTAIRKLSQTKSLLVVAHRLVSIANANLILVVKDGAIQERGNHMELLNKNGLYAKLWQAQYPLAKTNCN